ncbi:MAG: ABC transporter substrate-binding protein [Deltaproteobacteria bacterium]|nr:ABC transporter substrate-binding protein [Deltaproteobacteria bacterium]MBW2077226.1 ABC transporter substrate-binding protein [Deltaproteobacteria bacterium]MBW2309908.1 ABC transporter substrate-binding protein [Deltaproteobacteria bacterium]
MKKKKILIGLITFVFLFALSSSVTAKVIRIGGLTDCTGATSDVGKDYALGLADAWRYVNETGGINGKEIKYTWFDYGYRIPEALTKYKLLKRMGVIAIEGWGTGDTEALSPTVLKDKIPYVSASFSAHLTDPTKAGYNLFFAPDYSTQARANLTVWFETRWPKHKDYGKRAPKLACVYAFPSPYASAPIKAIKDQAKMLGFEIGPDQDVALTAIDTKSQIMALEKFDPDVCWHGNTTMAVSATMRDAYSLGLEADWLVNYWGYDENLPKLAAEAAQGAMCAGPSYFFGSDKGIMKTVKEYAQKYNPGVPLDKRLKFTVTAWANVLLLREALIRADKAGDLTGPGILHKGFETMRDFAIADGGLGTSPVTYTSTDHRSTAIVPVFELKDGGFYHVKTIDLEKRWPQKWAEEWLGW